MSNIIPPLLSSSPPPMVGTISFDDDDEFGTFTMATDLQCDSEVPVSSLPCESPTPKINSVEDELDRRKSENESECVTKYNSFQYFPEIPPDISEFAKVDIVGDEDDPEISEIFENEFSTSTVVNDIKAINVDVVTTPSYSEEDFADFNTYTQNGNISETTPDSPRILSAETEIVNEEDDDDDEFGDFNDCSVQTSSIDLPSNLDDTLKVMFPILESVTADYVDEDFVSTNVIFVQLKDITDTPALLYQWGKSNSQSCLLQALNIDTRNILYGPRWNESMPRYAATLGFTPLEPIKSDILPNTDVGQVSVPQTDIPTAEFDWVGSGLTNPLENSPASTMLLDLEQLASLDIQYSSSHSLNSINAPSHIDDLDDWEFWLSLTPSKIEKQQTNDGIPQSTNESISQIEVETNSINTLPNLDKSETDFDDFHSFPSIKAEERMFDTWPMALRETHISNVKIEDPSWLKPTILTPELPRKELQTEEEFANFQSGNLNSIQDTKPPQIVSEIKPEIATVDVLEPSKLQPVLSSSGSSNQLAFESLTLVQDPVDDDDEFTEFQSITCPQQTEPSPIISEPLQPSILQPVKVENVPSTSTSTTINWPDPGITEEDLQRFSSYKPVIKEPLVANDTKASDEDWSDFVSNQTAQLNNLHIAQPVQNGFQKSLVSNQYVVFAPKPDEIEDEWNDFVSSEPPPEPPVFNRPPRTSLPKLNLDWNSPPQFSSWSSSVTPNIITNPTSFESFQSFTTFDGDLLKNRMVNKKTPNIMVQPKKNTVPSISTIPDMEFIAPKNRTWKK